MKLILALFAAPILGCASLSPHHTLPNDFESRTNNAITTTTPGVSPYSQSDRGAAHSVSTSPPIPSALLYSQQQPDPNFQLAEYRSAGNSQQYPELLAGTMFDGVGLTDGRASPYGGNSLAYNNDNPNDVQPLGGTAVGNPEMPILPLITDQLQPSESLTPCHFLIAIVKFLFGGPLDGLPRPSRIPIPT